MSSRIATRTRGLHAALLALLLLAANIAGPLHMASMRHAVCAEHGELVHVDAHAEHSATPSHADERGTTPRVESTQTGAAHADEHCQLALACREQALRLDFEPQDALAILGPCVARAYAAPLTLQSFPRFLLAPKHSPPVA